MTCEFSEFDLQPQRFLSPSCITFNPLSAMGKIRIQKQHTMVDVPEKFVERVLGNGANCRIGNKAVTVQRA